MNPNKGNKKANTITSNSQKKASVIKKDMLDAFDDFFLRHKKLFLYTGLGLTFLFSLLLFDIKVSPGGDDSAYISRAFDFAHGFTFPGFSGPFYPIMLSLFIWIFGINLFILKLFSLVCIIVSMFFFYKTFSERIPQTIVTLSFILLSINYSLLYYSSQTYSEAFFIMLQSIFFWFAAKVYLTDDAKKATIANYLLLGFLVLLLTLTRNIAFAAIIAVTLFFLLSGKWKTTIMWLGGYTVCYTLFEVLKRLIWGKMGAQISTQASAILYKNFYNPSLGNEDFLGLVRRFIDNSNSFFSNHIYNFLGLRIGATETSSVLMILTWAIIGLALYWGFKKNKLLLLVVVYTVCMCSVSFISLQKEWSQSRMIITYLPFFLLIFLGTLYYATKIGKLKGIQFIMPLIAIILFFTSFSITMANVKKQSDILEHNLGGDALYGLTPDWKNYILMSKWAAANTPKEYLTVSRKPDISFIYGQRKFFGITKVPSITPDSLIKNMSDSLIYVGFQMEKIMQNPLYNDPSFRNKLLGIVNGNFKFGDSQSNEGNLIGIFCFSTSEFQIRESQLKQSGAKYEKNMISWLKELKKVSSDYSIMLPDKLLETLQKANVRYILLGSLRANPAMKTGNIIDTLHRYLYYIQLKYPNMFVPLHQIGDDDNEPAQLVEVKY